MPNPHPKPNGAKPTGRPKGSRNRMSKGLLNEMAVKRLRNAVVTPLDYMMVTLNDPQATKADKQWAAEKAAPYVHRRMPLAIEGGDPARPLVVVAARQLRELSPEEFALLQQLSQKLEALPSPDAVMQGIAEHVAIVEEEEKDGA